MRRYVKAMLAQIPAGRRYFDEKHTLDTAWKDAVAQRDDMAGEAANLRSEVAHYRGALKIAIAERDTAAAEGDTLRNQIEHNRTLVSDLSGQSERLRHQLELSESHARMFAAERDSAMERLKRFRAMTAKVASERESDLRRASRRLVAAADGNDQSAKSAFITCRFAILCMGRTGSTLLVNLLGSHPQIECEGELFQPFADYMQGRWTSISRKRYIGEEAFTTDRPIRGFKMPFDWVLQLPGIIEEFEELDFKIIMLQRQDPLDHFLSMKLAILNDDWASDRRYAVQSLRIDPWELLRFLGWRELALGAITKMSERMPQLNVFYEDLLKPETQAAMLSFLGAQNYELNMQSTVRARSKSRQQIIENYDEMVQLFKRSPYEDMFPASVQA